MTKPPPAHARRPAAGDEPDAGDGPGAARQGSPVALALQDLTPPRHGKDFWSGLDARLADEPQLRLAPRAAIRPITQPPPVVDDSNLVSSLKGGGPPPSSTGHPSRRPVVIVVVALLVALLVAAALQDSDDPTVTRDATSETTGGRTPTSDEADPPAATTPPVTPAPGTVDPAAPLTPAGVGPLTIGARMADLEAAGVRMQVDNSTFEGTGGRCYDAKVPGALDLVLRFRAPDGEERADEPTQGVLTSVSIESALPTARGTDSGIALGAPQDQVLAAYAGNLDERPHPFVSGGRVFRADAGNGTGVAFFTDGLGVTRISVGEMDTIRFINECG